MRPHAPRQTEEAGQFPEADRAEAECEEVGELQVGEQQQVAGVTGAEGARGGRGHGAAAGLGLAGGVDKTRCMSMEAAPILLAWKFSLIDASQEFIFQKPKS